MSSPRWTTQCRRRKLRRNPERYHSLPSCKRTFVARPLIRGSHAERRGSITASHRSISRPPERRATVDHAARSETEPPVSPPAPDSPEETNGESAGSDSNYGTNCADLSTDTAPICSEGGAHNSDWNCEWIAYCSTEIPPVETVPALPECAVSTPNAGQYQQADGQYQSDPACEPAPVETGCAAAGAVTPAVSAPDSTTAPVPADVPPTQPQPAEQPTTAPAVARPHGGTDGRAESPLTTAQQEARDSEGWSQVSTSPAADDCGFRSGFHFARRLP